MTSLIFNRSSFNDLIYLLSPIIEIIKFKCKSFHFVGSDQFLMIKFFLNGLVDDVIATMQVQMTFPCLELIVHKGFR